ncbi:MAG: cadmium-translocating P-type ATPase [Oceanospirillaceae bacterium]|nr:cadmium-translocating P-type ATPase [Oceanospirillaceae bacterium]
MNTPCYHCGADIPADVSIQTSILGATRNMCCIGCKTVAEAIIASGNERYYQLRTDNNETPDFTLQTLPAKVQAELTLYDNSELQKDFARTNPAGNQEMSLIVEGITCAACAWLIEKQAAQMPGVKKASLNLSAHKLTLEWQQSETPLSAVFKTLYSIGFKARPYSPSQAQEQLVKEQKESLKRLVVAGLGMMQVMMLAFPLYVESWHGTLGVYTNFFRLASLIMTTAVVFISARPFFSGALRDLRTGHLTMDTPVALAIGAAYIASAWATFTNGPEVHFESVTMFTFFLLIGRHLESKARLSTGEAGNSLISLVPTSALKKTADGEVLLPANQLKTGDTIIIQPGMAVPADGIILQGNSSVDESALTGEFLPLRKRPGDNIIAGTLNVESPLEVQVTAVGEDLQVATIIKLLDRAHSEKPAIALLADKVAQYFVAAVLIISVLVYGVWFFWIDAERAFWVTLSVLVVTCPCALGLATPTALTAASGALRKVGFLITRGHVLEGLAQSKSIVFDKTGTLTTGEFSITQHISLSSDAQHELNLAAALEKHSNHPIAHAFIRPHPLNAENIRIIPGDGLQGDIAGTNYSIGHLNFINELTGENISAPDDGHWVALAAHKTLALFKIEDCLKNDAGRAFENLHGLGMRCELLSGDHSGQVARFANELNADAFQAGMSPAGKLEYLQQKKQNEPFVMVGDGINDVPVLAHAPVSIAVGSASDLAKTHADVVLVSHLLQRIPDAVQHARKTQRIIKQNLTFSLVYNLLALPLAAMGLIPPYLSALGMSASSLVVVGNAMRLNKIKGK